MADNLTVTKVFPNTGSLDGGNTVTITGTGFTLLPQQVLFGKTAAANVQLISDTTITAIVPIGSTQETVNVTVYIGANISPVTANADDQYTYALPLITSVSPASGPINGGTNITIGGQYFTGASSVQFGTIGVASFTVNSDNEITTISPAGTVIGDAVDVQVMVQASLSATTTVDQFTYTQPPPLTITFAKDTDNSIPDGQMLIGFFDGTAPAVPTTQPTPEITYAVPNATFNIINNSGNTAISPVQLSSNFSTGWTPGFGYPFFGNWYTLTELAQGVSVQNFSGRIYVVYAASAADPDGWEFPEVSQGGWGYTPNPVDNNSNDFTLRFDQMELTYNGSPTDVADLTSINFWSIPMTLSTSLSGTQVASVTGLYKGATANNIFTNLSALGSNNAVVPNGFSLTGPSTQAPFVRVIGPASYAATGGRSSPYDNFNEYLAYVQHKEGTRTFATINGDFAGAPVPDNLPPAPFAAQLYNMAATMDESGDITLTGTVGSLQNVTITFSYTDLITPPGLYGANLPCNILPAPYANYPSVPGNDVYGWMVADLYLGFNIGAICNPAVGSQPSSTWYTLTQLFGQLQSNSNYYNQWAATLQNMSQAYNFAYSDRLKEYDCLISLAPGVIDTLNITLSDLTLQNS